MSYKQIEEMVIALTESQHEFDKAWYECLHNNGKRPEIENVFYAKYLIEKKGYRKDSEVASEIFEKIENALELLRRGVVEGRKNDGIKYQQLHDGRILSIEAIKYFIAELKKQYTESEKDTEEGK